MTTTTTLVLGATGATGKQLVRQLLEKDQAVRVILRSKEKLMESLSDFAKLGDLQVTEGTALDMTDDELESCVKGCDTIVSCLGHNMTMKGIYGKPRMLVKDSIKRVCNTAKKIQPGQTKVILMGSNGVSHPDGTDDIRPIGERFILGLLRWTVPPAVDNEQAAAYLNNIVGKEDSNIEWVVVRPNDLIDGEVSEYNVFPKPIGSLFGDGQTTRSNVAAFMSELILDEVVWKEWKYKMPVPQNI